MKEKRYNIARSVKASVEIDAEELGPNKIKILEEVLAGNIDPDKAIADYTLEMQMGQNEEYKSVESFFEEEL